MQRSAKPPKLGPEPTILSRKEVDALYDTLEAIVGALDSLGVEYIVTGGSLLGAVRQHSILFCDDDIDVTIIDIDGAYEKVSDHLGSLLGDEYRYTIKPWEGGDKVRPKRMTNVFVDIFCLRRYETIASLIDAIETKKNGKKQSDEYVSGIVKTLTECAFSQSETKDLCPFWHFSTRKAIEMWTKEVYRESELFPLCTLKFGPLTNIKGPRCPVLLLKRAFGDDCFHVYYQSGSHKVMKAANKQQGDIGDSNGVLKPLVMAGGTWEDGRKATLEDEHYMPCQPLARAKRRPTLHGKEQLFKYLEEQSEKEKHWQHEEHIVEKRQPERTIYMDGVFDLFHIGHLEAIRQCAKLGTVVIIGVTGDNDAAGYKRPPIMSQKDRVAIIASLKEVCKVVCPCPLVVTETFMAEHNIDLVVHGFANDADAERQRVFFEAPMKMGKFRRIAYWKGENTTQIIERVRALPQSETCHSETEVESKPQWFGRALAKATANAAEIPYDPFPLHLRQAIEPHIQKATKRRTEALDAICGATGKSTYQTIMSQFRSSLAREGEFYFDTMAYPLRPAFLATAGLPVDTDLSRLHEQTGAKDGALFNITQQPKQFQIVFDEFVRNVCAPRFASMFDCDEIYYQCFPCVRIVQPNEFSIGPHVDAAYGHMPVSLNFYLPLTFIGGASSLYLESRPGSEDWHPITGEYGEMVKHFAGAICTHWTTENKTELTRASLDFRLIAGPMFHALSCGGSLPGGQRDVYRAKEGYYSVCRRKGQNKWEREGELLAPDARVGFPFTVKNWKKILHSTR
mmetsp:Transcript_27253/g.80334  ORF Transcript_27253/g.80334 Transcript_27253/m.80334 type:complete len:794 (-) Transcript_27253:23-2404(-)